MTDPVEHRLLSMVEGDSGLARWLRDSLERLGDGVAGPKLQELARDALAGRTDLRQLAASDAYGDAISEQLQRFRTWYDALDPDERTHMVELARERTAEVVANDLFSDHD